jgi:hypothetical protein
MVKFTAGLVLGLFVGIFLIRSYPQALSAWLAWLPFG